jgi:hypothetical protein
MQAKMQGRSSRGRRGEERKKEADFTWPSLVGASVAQMDCLLLLWFDFPLFPLHILPDFVIIAF